MNAIKYILVFGFLGLLSFKSNQEYETIVWKASQSLSWSDFKCKAPENYRAAAITASGITYRFSTRGLQENLEVDFEITAHFYPHKSWYKPAVCDAAILGHEQLHFDISELYAQKMRESVKNTKFTSNVKVEVKVIYNQILKELDAYQNAYDDETNFSRNREAQLIWNDKIAKALKK